MENILLNSLNKKILALTIAVFIVGYAANSLQVNQDTSKDLKNSHKSELNPIASLTKSDISAQESASNIRFMPVEEFEQVLKDHEYEQLYVETDPNFDKKVSNIEKFLESRKSPLAEKARYLALMANKFGIDYRIVAAISIIESSGGTRLYRRYNAWGWGGSKGIHFENWEHSIYVVSKGLGQNYYARGATTPEQIAPAYNPHTPNEWSAKVRLTMNQIGGDL